MTRIASDAASAFFDRSARRFGNTQVVNDDEGTWLVLHGSHIAHLGPDGDLSISMAGYFTTVTSDRVKALIRYDSPFGGVFRSGGVGHIVLSGVPVQWDGEGWINVSEGLTPKLLMGHLDGLAYEIAEHPLSRKLASDVRKYVAILSDLVADDPLFDDFDVDLAFTRKFSEPLTPQLGWEIAYEELQNLKLLSPRRNPSLSNDGKKWSSLAAEVGWSPVASDLINEMMTLRVPRRVSLLTASWMKDPSIQLEWLNGRRSAPITLITLRVRFSASRGVATLLAGLNDNFTIVPGRGISPGFFALANEPDFSLQIGNLEDEGVIEDLAVTIQSLLDEMG